MSWILPSSVNICFLKFWISWHGDSQKRRKIFTTCPALILQFLQYRLSNPGGSLEHTNRLFNTHVYRVLCLYPFNSASLDHFHEMFLDYLMRNTLTTTICEIAFKQGKFCHLQNKISFLQVFFFWMKMWGVKTFSESLLPKQVKDPLTITLIFADGCKGFWTWIFTLGKTHLV